MNQENIVARNIHVCHQEPDMTKQLEEYSAAKLHAAGIREQKMLDKHCFIDTIIDTYYAFQNMMHNMRAKQKTK